jgi:putative membrane protein insertion efficiency factor
MIRASIRFYKRFLSPLLPKTCRFTPTCSTYALQAFEKHGVVKGILLSFWRICRCNPWHHCDYIDPVPESFAFKELIKWKGSAINAATLKEADYNEPE